MLGAVINILVSKDCGAALTIKNNQTNISNNSWDQQKNQPILD